MSLNFSNNSKVNKPFSLKGVVILGGLCLALLIIRTVFSYLSETWSTGSEKLSTNNSSITIHNYYTQPSSSEANEGKTPSGCSVITVSKGNRVFFGGNDDYINPDSYYWVDQGGAQGYGAIWVGTPDNVQQGVNVMGLAYDANGLPRVDVNPHLERSRVSGGYSSYPIQILHECATVEEVINWVKTHQWHSYMHDQMHFADATGDAVIISAGADGEVAFTRKPQGDSYLVSTNFNVANPSNSYGCCTRFDTAERLLGNMVSQEGELTYQDATDVMDAVHVEGGASWTIETLVADLPNGIVYLYYFHQYDKPVVLNVAEEIANGRAGGPLSKLFPEDVQQEAERRYQRIQAQKGTSQAVGKVWLGLVIASLLTLLIGLIKEPKGLTFWIPIVTILGPLGLFVWLAVGRKRMSGSWRVTLVEALGDSAPVVVAFMIYLCVALFLPVVQASQIMQILLIFFLPILVGWLVFQGPLLVLAKGKKSLRIFIQQLPHTWVTANLGMAAGQMISAPLVILSIQLPVTGWNLISWWAFTVLSSILGILLQLPFQGWSVRRGYMAWSTLAAVEGEITSVPWHQLWMWILLSYAVLIGGVIASVFLQQILSG